MEGERLKRVLEAALFMAPSAMGINDLARVGQTNVAETRVALNELVHDYEERHSAITIREEAGGFRMHVKPDVEGHVSHLASSPEFHKGIMKTLAYIAYKQPVEQAKVIHFRHSKAYDHIRLLKEKGFIRKERHKNTYHLTTTKKFQDYFGKSMEKSMATAKEAMQESD